MIENVADKKNQIMGLRENSGQNGGIKEPYWEASGRCQR